MSTPTFLPPAEVLRHGEEHLRLALEAARMATFEYNVATQTVQRSRNALLVQGLGEHGVAGEYFTHVHSADRTQLIATIDHLTPEHDTYEFEYRLIRPDTGAVIWLLDRAQAFFDTQGQMERLIGVVLDITPRKRTEEQLVYQAFLLEHIQDAVIAVDNQQCITLWNRGAEELYGWQQAEVLGRPLAEVVKTNTTPQQHTQRQSELNQHGRQVHEAVHQHRDGRRLVIESVTNTLYDATGAIIGYMGINVDITARKQAEIGLKQSNAILSGVLEGTNDAVFVRDLAGRYLLVNSAALEQVGMTREALIGHSYSDLFSPEEVAAMREDDRPVLEQGLTKSFENASTHNGVVRYWHTLKTPLRNAAGEIIGLISSARDITERKRAEAAVAARETELRVITDNIPGLISYVDSQQHYRFINAAYEQWFNQPREQFIGQPMITEQRQAIFVTVQPYIERALRGEFVQFEATLPYPSGERTVWATYVPNSDKQGVVHGFYVLVTDISERKRAEEKIRHLNAEIQTQLDEMQALLEILPTGVWIGNADCSEIIGNPAAYQIMGLTPGINASVNTTRREVPSDLRLFVNGAEVPPKDAPMQQVARTGKPWYNFEHEILFANGMRRAVYGSIVPLFDHQGAVRKVIGAYADFTERKQAEEALRNLNNTLDQVVQERTAELTKRLRELDQFAYVTSHDLKAPLRAIDHLAHWINDDAGELLPPTSRDHLSKMRARIKRMEKLLDDLLAYSRADRYEYQVEKVSVARLMNDIVHLVTPPQGFAVNIQTPLPVFFTQKVPLETVLRNLISNAIKHHDRTDGQVQVAVQDLGEFLEFSVSDDGPGIPPEYHERIFQLFQTLKPRDQVEGSGMGLAIVKKIIESRNGHITVLSSPGQGATFRFTWPKGKATREND